MAPRSTPQLSFSVRWLKAHCGVVITASHNPPHDNGFKAYFEDGAQVVAPHDKGIIDEVNAVPLTELGAFLAKDLAASSPSAVRRTTPISPWRAQAALDPAIFKRPKFKVVFTNIHGTGGVATRAAAGACRRVGDGGARAGGVRSALPDGEIAQSGERRGADAGVALGGKNGAELVLATDPDGDRMGCRGARSREGSMVLLTGNQIGALLADYRLRQYKELGLDPGGGFAACRHHQDLRHHAAAGRHRPRPRGEGHQHADRLQMDRARRCAATRSS